MLNALTKNCTCHVLQSEIGQLRSEVHLSATVNYLEELIAGLDSVESGAMLLWLGYQIATRLWTWYKAGSIQAGVVEDRRNLINTE